VGLTRGDFFYAGVLTNSPECPPAWDQRGSGAANNAFMQRRKSNTLGKVFAIAGFGIGCFTLIWTLYLWYFKGSY
jgi:hypothetical protein